MNKLLKLAVNHLVLSGILLTIVLLAPFTIGLLKAGFQIPEILSKYVFYESLVAFLPGILIFMTLELIFRKGDDKYGDGTGFASLGEKPSLKFFKRFTILQITLISLILFLFIGVLLSLAGSQTTYTGVGFLEKQQFTAFDNISYNAAIIPIAENLSAAFVIVLSLFFLRIFARKYNWSESTFTILSFMIIPLLIGVAGVVWHQTVYASSEIALITTFVFWLIGGLLTMLTGVFTIFWMQHLVNNFLTDINFYLSSDIAKGVLYGSIILVIIVYILIYKKRLLGDSKLVNVNTFQE